MAIGADGPKARYEQDLQLDDFQADAAQRRAVDALQAVFEQLQSTEKTERKSPAGFLLRLFGQLTSKQSAVKGLYLWGGVGRGKTYLMDSFYESLSTDRKLRVHFHRFMRRVHKELRHHQGEKNPLVAVAAGIAAQADVICFDEFFVSDITDAMLLGGLFELLFEKHAITLVATSNIPPDELYKDGLQRARFLPAIELLKVHTDVMNVDGGVDYRLRTLESAELYHYPADAEAELIMEQNFRRLAPEPGQENCELEIEGRLMSARWLADDVVWFNFSELCDGPRSQNDYIELAREFHAVLLSSVPQLGPADSDRARRFINLVDEFYDRCVKLIVSADCPIDQLYTGGSLEFEFQRTRSRLLEMQSHDYLAKPHRA